MKYQQLKLLENNYNSFYNYLKNNNNLSIFENLLKFLNIDKKYIKKFNNIGIMLDISRGAVFKIEYLKEILLKFSMLGVNEVWFYLEDTFKLGRNNFSYQRQGYTLDELNEIDEYAQVLNIELVMCIQTLGHMTNFLRWEENRKFLDQSDVLLAGDDDTYDLISDILKFCKKAFKSTKIHIGCDETFGLGLGNYFLKNNFTSQLDIFIKHLNKVYEMAKKEGFTKIMAWSDMIFQLSNKNSGYYDTSTKLSVNIPKDLVLVYWDYYNKDYNKIKKMVEIHKDISKNFIFASGFWTWQHPITNYYKNRDIVNVQIDVLNELKVDEIIYTCWNDNGAYVDFDSVYFSLFKALEKMNFNKPINKLYEYVLGEKVTIPLNYSKINTQKINPIGILYDDILMGIYLNNFSAIEIKNELDNLLKIKNIKNKEYKTILEILILKLQLRLNLLTVQNTNKDYKSELLNINKLIKLYEKYLNIFEIRWLKNYKMAGLDIHQYRLGGIIQRLKGIVKMINNNLILTQLDEKPTTTNNYSILFNDITSSTKF